ncbi:MAG: EAL domain-containing protein [Pseudomonadota bacterium]
MPAPDGQWLSDVFPFHIRLGQDLAVTALGPSATKLFGATVIGASATDILQLLSPRGALTPQRIAAKSALTQIWQHRHTGVRLRGQVVCNDDGSFDFLCTPWLDSPDDVRDLGLVERDFAPHETVIEHVYINYTRAKQLEELNAMNTELQATLRETRRLSDAEAALTRDLEIAADLRIHIVDDRIESIDVNAESLSALPTELPAGLVASDFPQWLASAIAGVGDASADVSTQAYKIALPNGACERKLDVRVSPVRAHEFIVLGRDVTDSQAEYFVMLETLETAMAAVVMLDEHDRVTFFNRAAEDLLMYDKEQIVGRGVEVLLTPKLGYRNSDQQSQWLTHASQVERGEGYLYRQDNAQVLCSYSVSRIRIGGRNVATAFIQDITIQREVENQIRHQANHDTLTGLPNRHSFLTSLNGLFRSPEQALSIALIDIDNFKPINDLLGHAAGDLFLQNVAERLIDTIRETDVACRLGGDEFAVILKDIDSDEAGRLVMEKVLAAISAPMTIDDVKWEPSASIGVAMRHSNSTSVDLLRHADLAMYEAKANGKGCVHCYTPQLTSRALKRIETQKQLERALANGEITAHFQPVVDLSDGQPIALEALARWTRSDGTEVPPGTFIPVAENSDLILRIEDLVVDEAFRTLRALREDFGEYSHIAVHANISARHFVSPSLVPMLKDRIALYGIEPKLLVLELTESILLNDSRFVREQFDELRALGVRIALDDFGTGYSSLSYLEHYSFDLMKIDKSFVSGIADVPVRRRLTEVIVAVSQVLGISVIAEGIEKSADEQTIVGLGCRFGQGFLYARPMSAAQLAAYLKGDDTAAYRLKRLAV